MPQTRSASPPQASEAAAADRPEPDAGDAVATGCFGQAIAEHRPYLLRFARRRLRDSALADDLVQETLLAALQGQTGFRQQASLRTWLTGILLHRIADFSRSRRRDRVLEAEVQIAEGDGGVDGAAATSDSIDWLDPQRSLESRQFLQALDEGLAALPPLAARVFSLRELDGLSNREVADQLGLSPNRAAVLFHRSLQGLRAGLRQRWRALSESAPALG